MFDLAASSRRSRLGPFAGRDPFLWLWGGLRNPLLLVGVAVLLLLFVAVGLTLPQLPGQYADDRAATARWLLTIRTEYGPLGPFFASLKLFDLLHSPVLRLGMALLGLLLFVHLGDQLANLHRHRRLPGLLSTPVRGTGEPLPVPGALPVYRWRTALDAAPDQMAAAIDARLSSHFAPDPGVTLRQMRVAGVEGADPEGSILSEVRWLVQGRLWAAGLRPLLLVGLLLALAVLWVGISFGWEVTPPTLAPGETFRFPRRNLALRYLPVSRLSSGGVQGQAAALEVQIGDAVKTLSVLRGGYTRLNNTGIWVELAAPGLFLESQADAPLQLPGQSGESTQQGFVFPAPGSEQSVLIPDAGVGLRMVRLGEDGVFLVEVIGSGQAEAIQRFEIRGDEILSLPVAQGDGEGGEISLHIRFLPGLRVRVRYMPGDWLLWLGLAAMLVGAPAYWRRPFFTLVQLGPWPQARSVLVVQSDTPEPLRMLGKEDSHEVR